MKPLSLFEKFLKLTLPCGVIVGGYFGAQAFLASKPQVKKREKQEVAQVVSIRNCQLGNEKVVLEAMGTVKAQRQLDLKAQVSGLVTWLNPAFVKGAQLQVGDELLHIEKVDYEVTVQQAEAEILAVQADIDLELGRQEVAKRELKMLGKRELSELEKKLTLRQPQLMQLQAQLKSAQLKLRKAKLDLERCVIKVPFNSIVENRTIELGGHVSPNNNLATITNTDRFWVALEVPVDRLAHIKFAKSDEEKGSAVKVFYGSAQKPSQVEGHVRYLMTSLQEKGRMAQVLVSVEDPLGLKSQQQPLLAESFVKAEIDGGSIHKVVRLERSALRDSAFVWKAKEDEKGVLRLSVDPVEIIWQDTDSVFINGGISPGDQLVVSDIATPVKGMLLEDENQSKKKRDLETTVKNSSEFKQGV